MKHRILYVEDEKILGQLVAESLRKAGYDLMLIANGIDVIRSYREFKPHLCLLDVMLPGKDGFDVARQIRTLDTNIPIVFLTAKVQVSDVIAGFNTGGNDYIRKPFSMDELLVRIASWLREKYGQAEVGDSLAYSVAGYDFYPKEQLLITPSAKIALTYKECIILTALFAHKNSIVNREHLQQKVWGAETIYNSRTLDVYINRLRNYFSGSNNKILTLRGVGYKFIAG